MKAEKVYERFRKEPTSKDEMETYDLLQKYDRVLNIRLPLIQQELHDMSDRTVSCMGNRNTINNIFRNIEDIENNLKNIK